MKQPVETGGIAFSFREKIELAKLLDRVGVPVIETAPIVNRRTDSLLIKSLASAVRDSVIATPLSLMEEDSAAVTWSALKEARKARLQVVAPVSTVQMEYICRMKPAAVLEQVKTQVAAAKAVCGEVEFVAEDAGRSEPEFLRNIAAAAVEAGASIVTICDTAGNLLPEEFYASVKAVREDLPEPVRLGVKISNELFLADACAVSAVLAGADEVKTAACGDFTASLEKLVYILKTRGNEHGLTCPVRDTELRRTINQIRRMGEAKHGKTPYDTAPHDGSDAVLTVHDDMDAVMKAVAGIGYDLGEEDAVNVYNAFMRIAEKKESVGIKELDAIVASAALQVPQTYKVQDYVINSGNVITATSHIRMEKDGQILDGLAVGDGPVDASFLAIEQIVGHHYDLDDLQVRAVTEGREAMGETIVRLRSTDGRLYSGRGISTDIIGSSIRAYVSAVNKIIYEEGTL
ncbi:MAG: hypothetical protein IJL66_00860 [Lachnospiraceae bacterium]|nr:hypothetical protein [Lachnospiraceae bacterium]